MLLLLPVAIVLCLSWKFVADKEMYLTKIRANAK